MNTKELVMIGKSQEISDTTCTTGSRAAKLQRSILGLNNLINHGEQLKAELGISCNPVEGCNEEQPEVTIAMLIDCAPDVITDYEQRVHNIFEEIRRALI